jgi:hypothetical protein
MPKKPKARSQPNPRKEPHAARIPTIEKRPKLPEIRGGQLMWRFSAVDRGGPFSWSALEDSALYKAVMEKLHNFETMIETEIRAQGSHPVDLDQLSREARHRLEEIKMDDLDTLMSFRLTGAGRVWCRMSNSLMLVLWWDPAHAVCPSLKKHT